MKKNKKSVNIIIITISAIIVVLLCYFLFFNKQEIRFNINESIINLKIGEKKRIEYSINNNDVIIEWSSNSDSVTIDNNGNIIANDYGNAIITGTIRDNDEIVSSNCTVIPYSGEIGVKLENVDLPFGYFLMMPNSEMDLSFTTTPENAYINSIDYTIDDESIAEAKNQKIISKNPGSTSITTRFNNSVDVIRNIKVDEKATSNGIVKEVEEIAFKEENIVMEVGEVKTLEYVVTPEDSYIANVEWSSSDDSIAMVYNGKIQAINIGNAEITLTINGKKITNTIRVKSDNSEIKIDYNPKLVIKVNENTSIKAHIDPININDTITYKSSNPSVASVENGVIKGISQGSTQITMSISNGKSKTYTIKVLPLTGRIDGTSVFWGYKSLNSKTPVLATASFFQKLAQNGVGTLQDNKYIINSSGQTYTFSIDSEILSVSKKNIKLRIYYPDGVDLSTTNTLVYMGGRGETNFYGVFSDIKKDPSIIKNGGIVALIAEGNKTSFDGESGAYVTKFLKAITKQKSGVKNSILGFSDGAHQVYHAAKTEVYDRIVIFSGYVDIYNIFENAKNTEIMFMIGSNDGNYSQAKVALNNLIKAGFKNLTMVSMGSDLTRYESNALVINPGKLMKNGHLSENVLNSGIIEYLND